MKANKVVNNKFGNVPEKLSAAGPNRQACAECGLHGACDKPFVKPFVPEHWTGRYLFVMEMSADGERSAQRTGVPLGGRERAKLRQILQRSEIAPADCAFVPVLRCRPNLTGSKKPKMHSIRACRPFLLRAVEALDPQEIICFGETAVKSVRNTGASVPVALLRGRALTLKVNETTPPKDKVWVTSKLSSLLVDPYASLRMTEDLSRLAKPELPYPSAGLPSGPVIGFDTEYGATGVYTLGVSDNSAALAVQPEKVSRLVPVLKQATLVGHNLPVDIEALIRCKPKGLEKAFEQWLQGRKQRDTLLEAKLADENRGKYGYKLESLAVSLFNVKDWKGPTEALGPDSSVWPPALRDERCRLDAWATLQAHNALQESVEGPARLSHAIAMSLRRMYWTGVYVDHKKYLAMEKKIELERAQCEKVFSGFAKKFGLKDFRPTNDNDIRKYVYDGVGLEVESKTKGGLPSTSVKVLKEHKEDKAIQALIAFSKADKLQSTYCQSLAKRFVKVKDGTWMPVAINALAAKTGRRSSNAPNFQNWPVSVRQIICSRFPGGSIADNDYSKLEPILGGWVSNEPRLTEYFVKYPNGYIKIGEDFFKKTVEKNTKEYTAVKSLILAIIYNKKRWSLAEDLWVNHGVRLKPNYEDHEDEAGKILDSFLDMFPNVRRYHQRQEETALTDGKVYNALGQCRRVPLPDEPPRAEKGAYRAYMRYKAHVINQAINYPIQSLAAYVTGCALIDLEAAFLREWNLTYLEYQTALMEKRWPRMPLLQIEVHDDLVQDIPKGLEKKTREITHEVMSKPPSLFAALPALFESNVKLTVDTNVAPCWGMKS